MNIDFNKGLPLKDNPDVLKKYNIHYHSLLSPQDAKLKNTSLIKYLEVNINNVPTLIIYKFVKIMKTQYVRLLHTPITSPSNPSIENKILNFLAKEPLVQEIITSQEDLEAHELTLPNEVYAYDFFSTNEDILQANKGKHKSKIKYTKYKDNLSLRIATIDDMFEIHHIVSAWISNKEHTGLFNKKTFKNIQRNYPKLLEDKDFLFLVTLFDNKVIAFQVIGSHSTQLFQLVNQAYPTLDYYYQLFNDLDLAKEIHAYAHKWQHLLTLNFLQDYSINYGYAQDPNGGLYNFKNMLYKNKLPLYRLKFKKST